MRPLHVRRLGRVPYDEALALQQALVAARKADDIPDTLLLLEHPHVITLGVRASSRRGPDGQATGAGYPHILASREQLAALGVAVSESGRGGDVTYHGPGQIVGYPILDLRPDRQDVHRYVRDLEEVLIRACADLGVTAERLPGATGAWVRHVTRGHEKVAAIGVRISRWITSHGFALNVNTDLDYFRLIVPCGIADKGVTSLDWLGASPLGMAAIEDRLVVHFASVFERAVQADDAASILPSPLLVP